DPWRLLTQPTRPAGPVPWSARPAGRIVLAPLAGATSGWPQPLPDQDRPATQKLAQLHQQKDRWVTTRTLEVPDWERKPCPVARRSVGQPPGPPAARPAPPSATAPVVAGEWMPLHLGPDRDSCREKSRRSGISSWYDLKIVQAAQNVFAERSANER